ncbi:MAG: hypothetical protein JSW11_03400 [Candidatus Heimdallarchaeota archaeon]|nr:MAG: hypothetical protein JSW11_03400 [Candidatus Heimdallarchaeota archaeon]
MVQIPANQELCLRCKAGKFLCGLHYCPIILKTKALLPVRRMLPKLKSRKEYYGPSPPSLFVGRFGYPNVRLGPMAALNWEGIHLIDEPDLWKTNMTLEDVVNLRAQMFRFMAEPVKVTDVTSSTKILEITQEQIQSSSPVDLEVKFSKKPRLNLNFNQFTQPMGTRIRIDSIQLTTTPKIDHQVDRVVSDSDLNAVSAVTKLYTTEATVTQISRILSAGLLGLTRSRKLVPTRWSITAVDDMTGNYLRRKIQDYPEIMDYLVFHNSYLDNDFWVLFIPGREWHFDYHEAWKQKSAWNLTGSAPYIATDTEGPKGRTSYATNTVGGYYAARLAVLEKLFQLRRKAAVIAFREVGKGYAIPLGVWAVRENMRQALRNPSKKFPSLDAALTFIHSQLTIPMKYYHQKSPLLKQKTLDVFFKK